MDNLKAGATTSSDALKVENFIDRIRKIHLQVQEKLRSLRRNTRPNMINIGLKRPSK
jgi:hypothetical protein